MTVAREASNAPKQGMVARMLFRVKAALAAVVVPLLTVLRELRTAAALGFRSTFNRESLVKLVRTDQGALSLTAPLAVVFIIVGAMLTMIVIAALFGSYTDAVRDINENLTTADFGDATTNSIAPVFAIVVGIAALGGLVGLIVYSVVKKGGSLF